MYTGTCFVLINQVQAKDEHHLLALDLGDVNEACFCSDERVAQSFLLDLMILVSVETTTKMKEILSKIVRSSTTE